MARTLTPPGPRATTVRNVERYATLTREAPQQRNQWILKMRSEGATVEQIARASGMTPGGVSRILHHLDTTT